MLVDAVTSPEAGSSDSKTGLAWVPDLQALAAWDEAERVWLATLPLFNEPRPGAASRPVCARPADTTLLTPPGV